MVSICLDKKLSFKIHISNLIKKLRAKLGLFYQNKSCFTFNSKKTILQFLTVLDASTLQPLNAVYQSALQFISEDHFSTHHCNLLLRCVFGLV